MKTAVVLLCVVGAVLAATEPPRTPVYGYHLRYGIQRANAIREAEARAAQNGGRIVGGHVTDISEVPYQVGLLMQVLWIFQSVCGGNLIQPQFLLTAAHCNHDGTVTAQSFTAVLGSNTIMSGGVRLSMSPSAVQMHPQWNPNTVANDIAIMRLPSPVDFSSVIQPIALPSGADLNNRFVRENALASGWGAQSDNSNIGPNQLLHSVRLPVVEDSVCKSVYDLPNQAFFHDSNVCVSGVGGRSTCGGDSGGPLVVDRPDGRILIGITSYGHIDGCEIGAPAAFARITSYLGWINSFFP